MRLVRHADLVPQPWKNGGGITREVCVFPTGAGLDGFDWRLSMATVASDGPFSAFPGIDRVLMVLSGGGMDLHLPEGSLRIVPGQMLHFAGEMPVRASLPGGPVEDLNLMVRRDRLSGQIERLALAPRARLVPHDTVRAVVVQTGAVQSAAGRIGAGDTLLMARGDRVELEALSDAALALVSLSAPQDAP